jgi:hypothetical protein
MPGGEAHEARRHGDEPDGDDHAQGRYQRCQTPAREGEPAPIDQETCSASHFMIAHIAHG